MSESTLFHDLERLTDPVVETAVGDRPIAFARDNMMLYDLETYLEAPLSIRRDLRVVGVADFAAYVQRFRDQGSMLYACTDQFTLRAILDDHAPDEPRWGRHTVTMKSELGLEYAAWKVAAGKSGGLTQEQFARFLNDRRRDIVSMDGADLLGLVADFKASQNGVFRSARNLQNGDTQFEYSLETRTGSVVVPEEIKLWVRVFEGQADPVEVRVRLLYRINEGKLAFFLEIPDAGIFERETYVAQVLEPAHSALAGMFMVQVAALP